MTPAKDCPLCPRLAAYRIANRTLHPGWHNAPVPSFGGLDSQLLVIGQAPGVNGANRTGRPFTGDDAGMLLYEALAKSGFATGSYAARPDDGYTLKNCRITNAVRCAPPQHKLETSDKTHCKPFFLAEIQAMPNLRALLAIGRVAHGLSLQALGLKPKDYCFAHGTLHNLPSGLILADSFHTSRYNVNTGRITAKMFQDVVESIKKRLT